MPTNLLKALVDNVIHYTNVLKEKLETPDAQEEMVIISCDASITKNPGGLASVGFVIEHPHDNTIKISKGSPAKTINQAEYDAVYEALTTFFDLKNAGLLPVEVRSDSKLVIKQLNGEYKCNDPILERKRQHILELVKHLPAEVRFVWRPRNSTKALKEANDAAQNFLGVKPH